MRLRVDILSIAVDIDAVVVGPAAIDAPGDASAALRLGEVALSCRQRLFVIESLVKARNPVQRENRYLLAPPPTLVASAGCAWKTSHRLGCGSGLLEVVGGATDDRASRVLGLSWLLFEAGKVIVCGRRWSGRKGNGRGL